MLILLTAGCLVVVIVTLVRVQTMARKLDAVSRSHWDLRYEFARLRARVAKLDGHPLTADTEAQAAAVSEDT